MEGGELSLQEAADSRPCPKRLGQESDCPCTRAASGEEIRTPKRKQSRVWLYRKKGGEVLRGRTGSRKVLFLNGNYLFK